MVAAYIHEDAVTDGTFIKIAPETARAASFQMPLIITAAARREFVAGSDSGEDERLGRALSRVQGADLSRAHNPPNQFCPAASVRFTQGC